MASERQIAANRSNARNSTGPRTRAGRQRVRSNAYRHGLAAALQRDWLEGVEILARQLAGQTTNPTNPIILQHAREAAHAVCILERIEVLQIAWIQRTYQFGTVEYPPASLLRKHFLAFIAEKVKLMRLPEQTMPPEGPERLSEAIRRALSQLAKLNRYERRAVARRNRAFRALAGVT